ncbi:MAG: tyrosine--tRNA ligase [Planctomycetota bacterium]|jgi:tyrosyl-tRNA synthetase|nr:tyrosine--tRNA ligase [Planctomycetota bacterium]
MTEVSSLDSILAGTVTCHTQEDLARKLKEGRPLRVKLGVDPSSPDLHVGHSVQLRYLRRLQDLGHLAVLIVGDATAMVGDPTGKNATRPQLTRDEVDAHAETYLAQAGLILDMKQVEVVRNSSWFDHMGFMDAVRLCGSMTVARMLERDTFSERHKAGVPISMHEFLYPLMQARDSVEVRADIEIGGTDQTFNLLVGRELMRDAEQAPQVCITLPLLPGLDGVQKMSKSLGNAIGLTDPPRDLFGKAMSVPDALMPDYFRLATDLSEEEILKWLEGSPREAKGALALALTRLYHGEAAAKSASEEFDRIFRDKGLPDEIEESSLPPEMLVDGQGVWLVKALQRVGLVSSASEARRLIKGGGVRVDDQRVSDEQQHLAGGGTYVIQVGKRKFHRVVVP